MAQVYGLPEELDKCVPVLQTGSKNYIAKWEKDVENFTKIVSAWAKRHSPSNNELVGELFCIPIADGHASYIVYNTKPLQLIHLPHGDGYDAPDYMTRGIRVADIQAYLKFYKLFNK